MTEFWKLFPASLFSSGESSKVWGGHIGLNVFFGSLLSTHWFPGPGNNSFIHGWTSSGDTCAEGLGCFKSRDFRPGGWGTMRFSLSAGDMNLEKEKHDLDWKRPPQFHCWKPRSWPSQTLGILERFVVIPKLGMDQHLIWFYETPIIFIIDFPFVPQIDRTHGHCCSERNFLEICVKGEHGLEVPAAQDDYSGEMLWHKPHMSCSLLSPQHPAQCPTSSDHSLLFVQSIKYWSSQERRSWNLPMVEEGLMSC